MLIDTDGDDSSLTARFKRLWFSNDPARFEYSYLTLKAPVLTEADYIYLSEKLSLAKQTIYMKCQD